MSSVSPPVSCRDCGRGWNSPTMIEGLRLLGSCPRCGGPLLFREEPAGEPTEASARSSARELAPHLVLGLPRR